MRIKRSNPVRRARGHSQISRQSSSQGQGKPYQVRCRRGVGHQTPAPPAAEQRPPHPPGLHGRIGRPMFRAGPCNPCPAPLPPGTSNLQYICEHFSLEARIVHANRPASQFHPVEDQVIVARASLHTRNQKQPRSHARLRQEPPLPQYIPEEVAKTGSAHLLPKAR
jgi:hypothetical protein